LPLPLIFPQMSPTPAAPAAMLDRTLNPGAMLGGAEYASSSDRLGATAL
jgi:hypothetical protein